MNFSEEFDNLVNTIKNQVGNGELDAQTVLNSMQAIIAKPEKKEVKESTDSILKTYLCWQRHYCQSLRRESHNCPG